MRVIIGWVIAALLIVPSVSSGRQSLDVKLTVASSEYVVGEVVSLRLAVANVGTQEVPVWITELSNQAQLLIAPEGGEPVEFHTSRLGEANVGQHPITERLPPGKSKTCDYRVLYAFTRGRETLTKRSRLAFERPGTYTVKAVYSLPSRGGGGNLESNSVEIKVRQPEGLDAQVWHEIRHRPFLYFLQHHERLFHQLDDTPLRIAEILKEYPKSRYDEQLRVALRDYYDAERKKMTKEQAFDDWEMHELRAVLGIVETPPELWRGDRRLSVSVEFKSDDPTILEKICADLSRQSGVPLRVDPSLPVSQPFGISMKGDLRYCLRIVGDHFGGTWVQEKDGGYRLTKKK